MKPDTAQATGRPFLFDDVFAVNPSISPSIQKSPAGIPMVIVDDFLANPEQAREIVGNTPAPNWKLESDGRNFEDYFDCRLRFPVQHPIKMVAAAHELIAKAYRANTQPKDPSVDINWFMQVNPRRADHAVPHSDMTAGVRGSFTCLVYLNRLDECSGGTTFFRFKNSGSLILDETYVNTIKSDKQVAETGRDYWPMNAEKYWERLDSVDMAPGRLLIFPSEFYHAAFHPQDSFFEFPRLTLAFWMTC